MTKDKKTIYLFFGEDTFSSNQKVNVWRKEFEKKFGDINIEILEGQKLEANDLSGYIEAAPFLGEKRLVVIYDFLSKGKKDEQKKAAEVIENTPDTCICAFVENHSPDQRTSLFKKIKMIGQTHEFKFMTEAQVTGWILEKSKTQNIQISQNNANYLASLTGPNLWTLKNELEKIKMYCKEREVTQNDLDDLVKPTMTSSVFKLTDYLSAKNTKKSLETFNILRDSGEELIKILFMIARHFRILIQVHDLQKQNFMKNDIISKTGEHPYVIQIAMNQSRNFDMEKLKEIYRALFDLDVGIKTGKIASSGDSKKELIIAIEKFIVDLCK
jgi:DNA polymerase III subunit delta